MKSTDDGQTFTGVDGSAGPTDMTATLLPHYRADGTTEWAWEAMGPGNGIYTSTMVTLKGKNAVENVFINLGGILAAVVATVPTSRGEDYRTAVRVCHQTGSALLTGKESGNLGCRPRSVRWKRAPRANVENNMVALLIVGALGLLAAVFLHLCGGRGPKGRGVISFGFIVAFAVWIAGLIAVLAFIKPFIGTAHYFAAIGLFVCVIVVVIANAWRRQHHAEAPATTRKKLRAVKRIMIMPPNRLDRYVRLAWLMVTVGVVGIPLVFVHLISLFWLEIAVALLFAAFWSVQTIDIRDQRLATAE